ncbi:aldehyde dehydrogenase family protein [Sphingobium sp. CAP-1]|uniref:aldehyde dehydrogenase family protein n=1 Tax=Sphingobium sp. CAP-1 TaxID=2676077 RepID=UPI002E344020|nr:aldehyde dehydrogenase family protein [Sphingobium sp. CAP-1]
MIDLDTDYGIGAAAQAFLARAGKMLIGGQWVDSASGEFFETRDPATGRIIGRVAAGDAEDVDKAVRAARNTLEGRLWGGMLPAAREKLLLNLADLVERHAEELIELESLDNGKPVTIARMIDIGRAPNFIRYMAGWATKIEGATITPSVAMGPHARFHAYTLKEPVGVVGGIIPWNFPFVMALWKTCPALATGSTVVLKPAEQTPLTALRLGELIQEAGFPDGVVNIVTGLGETAGAALARHPGIDKIAFTGSTAVGKAIARAAADNVTRVTLELGGKSPVIIMPDADLDQAIVGAARAIFFNAGQVCGAGSRLFVHNAIYDEVLSGIARIASAMKIGPGLDPATEMGPLVSEEQRQRVLHYIESGLSEGGELLAGGNVRAGDGYFVTPTVFGRVKPEMTVAREEIFGPVLAAASFETIDEVVNLANDSQYGLVAGIWSTNINVVHRMIPRIRSGTVYVNAHNLMDPAVPFGGNKQSGYGREMSKMAIDMYTETKSVYIAY